MPLINRYAPDDMTKRLRYRELIKMTIFDFIDDVATVNTITGKDYASKADYLASTRLWWQREERAAHILQYAETTQDWHLIKIASKYLLNANRIAENELEKERRRIHQETGIWVVID